MSVLLALDPGIRGAGVAIFVDGQLTRCAYVKNEMKKGSGPAECVTMADAVDEWISGKEIDEVIVEWPRVYQRGGGRTKGDPNDLLALVGVDCALVAFLMPNDVSHVEPSQWKGQMTKEVVEVRVRSRLAPSEMIALDEGAREAKSMAHNMVDAVGIGLHHLGRFERFRVIARE